MRPRVANKPLQPYSAGTTAVKTMPSKLLKLTCYSPVKARELTSVQAKIAAIFKIENGYKIAFTGAISYIFNSK